MINKIQLDPDPQSFSHRVVKSMNSFDDVNCVFTTPDTATAFSHGLGKLPTHAYMRSVDKAASLYFTTADVAAWTSESVTFRINNSQVTAVVRIE